MQRYHHAPAPAHDIVAGGAQLAACACTLIAYVALASPNIVDGDSAELATLGAVGGRAHPSGYPLYVLWLRAWSWLPGATPAHTAAIATAILGALAIGVLHAACRAWGARPIAATIAGLPALARVHSPAMELGVRNLLRSLPPDAIVVVIADDQCFGGRYLQLARRERPDVAFLCAGLLPTRWYRAAWARRGLALPPGARPRLGAALLTTGRPVFVDPTLTELLAAFPSYPFGVVRRVLRPGVRPPSAGEVALINRDLYQTFELDYPRPGIDDDYAAIAHHRYAASWAAIAKLLDAAGDRSAAHDAFEVTRQLQPAHND